MRNIRVRNIFFPDHFVTFFLVFFLFFPSSQSYAGPDSQADIKPFLVIDADKQFEFAEHYFSNQEHASAISEYKRFIYFFPEDDRIETAMFRIGMAHFKSKRFQQAVNAFKTLIEKYDRTDLSIRSYLMISESYVKLNAFDAAIINLHNLITITGDENIQDEAYYRIGWLYIEMASWGKAKNYFSKISAPNKDRYRLKRLTADLDKKKLIPQKNPRLAGFLSIIPGAGFLYTERYQDARIAFLLNGVLMYAAYEAFDNDNHALGGIITLVELGFYAGNIYGAVSSAHKYNRTKTGQFIKKLMENHKVNFSAGFSTKGFCVALRLPF
ncbi:MAG: tetratricopeptide repeat protein [Candidatus Desulfatibia sp.]|uniref:tetratricopeptide repeat protein n=1 Tax=Candidatus Desulfatibia sp. TaxID=3101189 RepID=UPI002F31C659